MDQDNKNQEIVATIEVEVTYCASESLKELRNYEPSLVYEAAVISGQGNL